MNPRLMLSLWRERWGKAAGSTVKVPYAHGNVNRWTHWLPHSAVWSVTGLSALALLSCILFMGLMIGVDLSQNSQIIFSVSFACIAVYIRRYAGTLITLVLVEMAIIASLRYLYWRFDATLVHGFSLGFLFGFYLFVAECYLALLVFVDLVQSLWPLKQLRAPLPFVQDKWPTVDVFILCDDQSYSAIKLTSLAVNKLDWPRKKIKIYLIDGAKRDDLYTLAGSVNAHYLPHVDESSNHAGFLNRSLPLTNGELIAVFESGQAPDINFLKSTVGWFLRDNKLGMLQTPHHFLAPVPSLRVLEVVNSLDPANSCALLRRSIVMEVGGFDVEPVAQNAHMALTLWASGYGSGYIGFGGRDGSSGQNQNLIIEPKSRSSSEMFLVEYPLTSRSLLWKQRIASLHRALKFYYPVPRSLFFVAPVVYLLGDAQIIQTSPELFAAYALPHFVQAHIARSRTDGTNRFTLVGDLRETIFAWYLLIPTTLTLLRTEFQKYTALLIANKSDKTYQSVNAGPTTVFAPVMMLPYLFILSLNLAGFFGGMFHMVFSSASQRVAEIMYLLWAAYNLMVLAAVLAVAEEAQQVMRHTYLRLHLPAMIKLPSGRTVSCTTENFPSPVLGLSLPMPVAAEVGSAVSLSIFHAHRELVFPAVVVQRQDLTLGVSIADTAQKDYQSFTIAVLSRGPDWPKWMPGRGADRPFPKWVSDAFVAVPTMTLDFVTMISKHLHWARLDGWIQLWKKRND